MHKVFVYGSLKKGFHNHRLLEASTLLGEAVITGFKMYSLGQYPGIISHDDAEVPISGEVYEVDQSTMSKLDRLEGHPHYYHREVVPTGFGDAWVYILPPEIVKNRVEVTTGVWEHERAA